MTALIVVAVIAVILYGRAHAMASSGGGNGGGVNWNLASMNGGLDTPGRSLPPWGSAADLYSIGNQAGAGFSLSYGTPCGTAGGQPCGGGSGSGSGSGSGGTTSGGTTSGGTTSGGTTSGGSGTSSGGSVPGGGGSGRTAIL